MKLELVARPTATRVRSTLPPLKTMARRLKEAMQNGQAVRLVPNGVNPEPIRVALAFWAKVEGYRLHRKKDAEHGWIFWLEPGETPGPLVRR